MRFAQYGPDRNRTGRAGAALCRTMLDVPVPAPVVPREIVGMN